MSIDTSVYVGVGIVLEKQTIKNIWDRFDPQRHMYTDELWSEITKDLDVTTLTLAHDTEGLGFESAGGYDSDATEKDYFFIVRRLFKSEDARSMEGGVLNKGNLLARLTNKEHEQLVALATAFGQEDLTVQEFVAVDIY